jgi:hypothetical protein
MKEGFLLNPIDSCRLITRANIRSQKRRILSGSLWQPFLVLTQPPRPGIGEKKRQEKSNDGIGNPSPQRLKRNYSYSVFASRRWGIQSSLLHWGIASIAAWTSQFASARDFVCPTYKMTGIVHEGGAKSSFQSACRVRISAGEKKAARGAGSRCPCFLNNGGCGGPHSRN